MQSHKWVWTAWDVQIEWCLRVFQSLWNLASVLAAICHLSNFNAIWYSAPGRYNAVNFLQNTHKRLAHQDDIWGVFCEFKYWFTLCCCHFIFYVVSWYIGPRYNSTRPYFECQLHQPRLRFITGGYLVKRWFIPAAARARGQSNDLNREILASNLFNCRKEVINAPPVPSISRCIHIVYRHKNVWEYQWSIFIYNCMSTFLHVFIAKMPSSTAAPLVVKGANH